MKRPPRVLLFAARLLVPSTGKPGGNFFHVAHLASRLQRDEKVDLRIVTDAKTYPFLAEFVCSKSLMKYECSRITTLTAGKLLRQAVDDVSANLAHRPIGQIPFGSLRVPVVASIADLNFTVLKTGLVKRAYKEISYLYTLYKASAITCISEYTTTEVKKRYPWAAQKVYAVPHGTNLLPPPDESLASQISHRYWMTFGHRAHKNIELILAAMKLLNERRGKVEKLVIIGSSGPSERDWKLLATAFGLAEQVLFLGAVTTPQLAGLYKQSIGLLFVSKYEGFGLPVLEAMGLGKPVIVSNVCSLPEVVGDAAAIVPVDSAEKLAEAMNMIETDPDYRDAMVRRGRERARWFTWENAAKKTVDLYLNVLESNGLSRC